MRLEFFVCVLVSLSACRRSPAPVAGKSDAASIPPAPAASASARDTSELAALPPRTVYSFDTATPGTAPKGFSFGRTGGGAPGRWIVRADAGAKSAPQLLAQLDTDRTNFRFPIAVAVEPRPADVRVSVNCKMIAGRVDQACGLVLRYRDENNYLITRANALEDNVRLYTVRNGNRDELASHDVEVVAGVWHAYRFEARGEELRVWWDGQLVIEQRDETFVNAGSVGVWTKADSVTHFDDLSVEPLS